MSLIQGTTPGSPDRNGMPERVNYQYRGGGGRLLHGSTCPDCGGRVRAQRDDTKLGNCTNCRTLVELREPGA
jgi:hypothetical protein